MLDPFDPIRAAQPGQVSSDSNRSSADQDGVWGRYNILDLSFLQLLLYRYPSFTSPCSATPSSRQHAFDLTGLSIAQRTCTPTGAAVLITGVGDSMVASMANSMAESTLLRGDGTSSNPWAIEEVPEPTAAAPYLLTPPPTPFLSPSTMFDSDDQDVDQEPISLGEGLMALPSSLPSPSSTLPSPSSASSPVSSLEAQTPATSAPASPWPLSSEPECSIRRTARTA